MGKGNNLGMASNHLGLGSAWLCYGEQNDSYSEALGTRMAWDRLFDMASKFLENGGYSAYMVS
jgi:hypothetical protein